ncbi:MAG TPA: hypothetical protein VFV19_05905 [Candidatus Polarisedimenticolaceae bacterium]|nr:hypothetical protein [Candidatus Polarisedimenticolaceae bacterium]
MNRWLGVAALGAIALGVATQAEAQSKKEVEGYIAGGYVLSEGGTGDFTNDGWNISGGAIFRPAPELPLALRFDLGFNWFDANRHAIDVAQSNGLLVNDGNMSLGTLTAELMYEFGGHGGVGGYVAAGFGGMRRYGNLTTTVPLSGIWCDPWTGFCYPGYGAGQAIVADDTVTKFTYSAGAGVTFPVGHGTLYVEARYHWMEASHPSTQMLPILVGYRF